MIPTRHRAKTACSLAKGLYDAPTRCSIGGIVVEPVSRDQIVLDSSLGKSRTLPFWQTYRKEMV